MRSTGGPTETAGFSAPTARRIRRWICDAVIAHLQSGPYGLVISGRSKGHRDRVADGLLHRCAPLMSISNERGGGGVVDRPHPFRIDATDENAVLIRGILAAANGNSLDSEDEGRWFFSLQTRISDYADAIAHLAGGDVATVLPDAMRALEILRIRGRRPGPVGPRCPCGHAGTCATAATEPDHQGFPPRRPAYPRRGTHPRTGSCHRGQGDGKTFTAGRGADAGQLQSHLTVRSVEGQHGEGAGGQLLRRLQARQSRAAELAWAAVTRAVQEVEQVIDPAEDLADTFKNVDRLVKEGGDRSRLPRADSRELYDMARQGVDTEAMETYRRLSKKIDGETGPGDLWDVLDDPLPQLDALRRYAAVTSELLSGMATSLEAAPGTRRGGHRCSDQRVPEPRPTAGPSEPGRTMMPASPSLATRAEALLNRLAQVEAQETDRQARLEIEKALLRASRSRETLRGCTRRDPGAGRVRRKSSDPGLARD